MTQRNTQERARMTSARDLALLAICSCAAAGFIVGTAWIWLAIGSAIMTVGR